MYLFYKMTYKEQTEELQYDFYTSLLRDILLEERPWETTVEIPLYVYQRREIYIEEILENLSGEEQMFLEEWYENGMDGESVNESIQEQMLPIEYDQDMYRDILFKIANEDTWYLLKHGASMNFPLEEEYQNSDGIEQLKSLIIEEENAYLAGEDKEFLYLTKIMKRSPACLEMPIALEMDIAGLDLSVRAYNCLRRAGIRTLGEMLNLNEEELGNIRNLGKKTMQEIIRCQNTVHKSKLFFRTDKNVFELQFSAKMIKLLLEQGYFFWSEIKNNLSEIEELLEKEDEEVLLINFEHFLFEKYLEETQGDERVTLQF